MHTVIEGNETPIEYLEKVLNIMREKAEEIGGIAGHLEENAKDALKELEVIKKEMAEKGD